MKRNYVVIKSLVLVALFGLFLVAGCKKEETKDNDYQAAIDNEQADQMSNDAVNVAFAAIQGSGNYKIANEISDKLIGNCAAITITQHNNNKGKYHRAVVNFGAENCMGWDYRNRRGKIIVDWQGFYFHKDFTDTVRFDNFYVNDHKIEGTHIVTNNGLNANNRINWTVQAIDMKVTRPDTKYHYWNSVRNRELTLGSDTLNFNKIVYSITGNATGTNIKGVNYAATITKALVHALDCRWIGSGTVEITRVDKPTVTLDFGNGACDNTATVTMNGKTYTINKH
jgi:hypothetical protein